jgi:hypothetical protein
MPIFKKILLNFVIFGFIGSSFGIGLRAEVLISPKNSENQDAFVVSVKKGEEITQEITLKNISNDDVNIVLEVGDLVQLDGGAVTTVKLDEKNSSLGKFATLETKNLAIAPLISVNVPVKISIPNDIASGEYGIGITISQTQKLGEKSAIQNVISRGLKMYIFVENGEKVLSADVEKLKVKDNKMIEFQAKNIGSVFSKIVGTYTLNSKNGEQKQGTFQRDIISSDSKQFLVSLPKDYSGEGTLQIEYSVVPLTNNGVEAKNSEIKNVSLPFSIKQDKDSSANQNIFQSIWVQIVGGILSLVVLGFVLRKEIRLLINLRKNR